MVDRCRDHWASCWTRRTWPCSTRSVVIRLLVAWKISWPKERVVGGVRIPSACVVTSSTPTAALSSPAMPSRAALGRPEVQFHDLWGAGLTWAATQGATTRELMARAGHASPAAALRYQHATADRDVAIAAALSGLAESAHARAQRLGPRDIRGMDESLATAAESSQRP